MENTIRDKYLELISEAESFIYIENQFFNAPLVADAIASRLWQVSLSLLSLLEYMLSLYS